MHSPYMASLHIQSSKTLDRLNKITLKLNPESYARQICLIFQQLCACGQNDTMHHDSSNNYGLPT